MSCRAGIRKVLELLRREKPADGRAASPETDETVYAAAPPELKPLSLRD